MTAKASYLIFGLLLLVGTQLATGKSVDETFKDDQYNTRTLRLTKRDANEESKEKDTTTLPLTEGSENDDTKDSAVKPSKSRRQTSEPTTTPAGTTPAGDEESTTIIPEKEDDKGEDDVATVKPLNDKDETPKNENDDSNPNSSTVSPALSDRIQPEKEAAGPNSINQPASNLLPPMPYNFYAPHYAPNFNGFIPPPYDPGFAPNPWGYGHVPSPSSGPYDYPYPSGPAFSDSKVGGGSSAFAGGFASASASAGGSGGTVSTSTSPGGGGNRAQQSSTSFSGSYPGVQVQSGPSFIGIRGSFGPNSDDESVAIDVNGPTPSGHPYPAYGPGYTSISGPGYSASASSSFQPTPFVNTIPSYGPYANPVDFQNLFQQYFAALQAQQQAFQQQLQAQIQAQQQAGGTFASSGAFITNDQGKVDPNAQVYVNTYSTPNSASTSTSVDSRSGIGGSRSTVVAFPSQNKSNTNRIWDQSNRVDSNFGNAGGSPSTGPQSSFASASLGPKGGFQTAQINPASPGIFSRFGDSIPPPSGNSYGVFSSSSSSSSTGPDGKQTSHKTATVGVNDNGKVTYQTVHDP